MRFPAATRQLKAGEPLDLPDEQGRQILGQAVDGDRGNRGVIAVKADEDDASALLRAKTARMEWLRRSLLHYREVYAQTQAMGGQPSLPREHHRLWLKEYRALRAELGEDEVLTAKDIPGPAAVKSGPDPIREELKDFGLENPIVPPNPTNLGGFEF